MEYLYYGAGFLAFLLLAVRAQQFVLILSFRLRKPQVDLISMEETPADSLAALAPVATELRGLGFELSHFMSTTDMNAAITKPQYSSVFYHPGLECYADLGTHLTPDKNFPWRVNFINRYEDGIQFMTFNQEAYTVVDGCPTLIAEDAFALTLAEQLDAHCNGAAHYEESQGGMARMPQLGPRGFVKALNISFDDYIEYLLEHNWVHTDGDHFRFKVPGAKRLLGKITRGLKRVKELHKAAQQAPKASSPRINSAGLVSLEVDAYQRNEQVRNSSRLKASYKAAILIVTILLFGTVFGVTWSLDTLVILIGVLLFHEMGHLAAMRAFGYRDLQILFIPFLGAAALGKHDNPRPYQRVIVSLMGPLPGLLLGTIMLWYMDEFESAWLIQLTIILLVVNFLNLLPIMPLDGGQLLNTVLFNHHPRWQFGFFAVSAALLLGWALLDSAPLLLVLAGIMLMQIPAQYRQMRVTRIMLADPGTPGELPEQRAFRALASGETTDWAFAAKYPIARTLRERITQAVPGKWEVVVSLLLYSVALALPFSYLINLAYEASTPYTVSTDWEAEIAATSELPEQLDIYVEAGYDYWAANDTGRALDYLERGKQAAESGFCLCEEYALLLEAMATIYQNGKRDPGPIYAKLIDLRASLDGEDSAPVALAHHAYAVHLFNSAEPPQKAKNHIVAAVRIHRALADNMGLYTDLVLSSKIEERLGNFAEAESALQEAAGLGWDEAWQVSTQVGFLLSDLYVRNDKLSEARRQLQTVLDGLAADDHQLPYALNRAGWVELFDAQAASARAFFDRARQIYSAGDHGEGEFAAYLYITDGSSHYHRLLYAVSYWLEGDTAQAAAELTRGSLSNPQQYEKLLQEFTSLLITLREDAERGIDSRAYETTLDMLDSLRPMLAIE